jgi:hypothetical protein
MIHDSRCVCVFCSCSPLVVCLALPCRLFLSKFPNIDYAPRIKCPVFIVHGTQDEVVPFWHGEDLFMSLPQQWRAKPFWVEGAGHNNIEALLRPTGAFVDKLVEFLDLHVSARRGRIVPPLPVPDCVPLAIREMSATDEPINEQ